MIKIGLLILILLPQSVIAQIASGGTPLSRYNNIPAQAIFFDLSTEALEQGKQKMASEPGLKPFLFAIPVDTSISVLESGQWDELTDGSRICRLGIKSAGAFSLNITFSEYSLPPGASVFIYTPGFDDIRGAYTNVNNKKSGKLATTPLPGDEIIIELNITAGELKYQPSLRVGRIAHDIKDPFGFKSGYGKSGDCNVDINCQAGNDWQVGKRSVCKFIRGGVWLCTGALINNTANDGRALLYTANHCIGSQSQAETSVFYFNYESPSCDGPNGRLDHSISGSDLLATRDGLDFGLVELSIVPPPEFEPYYAGWNRTVSSSNENVTCIHHPSGDVKKISKCLGTIVTGDFGSGFDANTHWRIPGWDLGTTEGGSSGSPLFDRNHKIIGSLTGGDASCTYNYNDYFQKFFVCWDNYPLPEEQLKYWLDPLNDAALVWNGYDPNAAGRPVANFDYIPNPPVVGKQIRFKDKSEGQPSYWEWSFENGIPAHSTQEQPVVHFNSLGQVDVKLVVSNNFGKDSVQQTLLVRDYLAFKADQNRIVTGSSVKYTDLSTGEPLSLFWQFQGGEPGTWSGPDPIKIQYLELGTYDVSLVLEYLDFTDTLYYRDFIKVEPETILYAGSGMSAIKDEYASDMVELDGLGWIAGNNTIGINAFANVFSPGKDTLRVATGIRIPIGQLPGSVNGTYLTAVIWDDEFNEIIRDSVELSKNPFPDNQTVWFRHPVGIDSLVYAGFIVPKNQTGLFCSKIATPRSLSERGSAFAHLDGNWVSLFEATGLVSDLGITMETGYIFTDYNSQIKLSPRITSDRIYLDLSNLVYEKFDVQIYDMLGRKMFSNYSLYDKYLELEFLAPVSGMYLMRFDLDGLSFTKKILLIRNL